MLRLSTASILLVAVGCQTPTVAHRAWQDSGTAEALAGSKAAIALERDFGGIVRNLAAEQRMNRVASRLAAANRGLAGPFTLRLLMSASRNAVSLPGHLNLGEVGWTPRSP